jgi:hypothetical protein
MPSAVHSLTRMTGVDEDAIADEGVEGRQG